MCGISGFIDSKQAMTSEGLKDAARRMADAMIHRGPDDFGVFAENGIALSHRRLSIVDLSQAGHQPMQSGTERYVISYNGELYNTQQLRSQLSCAWRGHSDTEVLLAAVEAWGVEETLRRMNGMFAFALWDKKERQLTLARDRFGEKPLHYGEMGGYFMFASELKAMRKHPGWQAHINRDALGLLTAYNYIPAPYSIFEGVYKLLPAHFLQMRAGETPRIASYWRMDDVVQQSKRSAIKYNTEEQINHLDKILKDSVGARMVSDVPIGAFLSGGIDSSLIVALMQAQASQPVRTFTIGWHQQDYNEAAHAKAVANHLGTMHTEFIVEDQQALDVVSALPFLYDEPFADASQIPTYLVSKLTRQHVTVALSGDGGDELFGGYNRHRFASTYWPRISKLPVPARALAAHGIRTVPVWVWDSIYGLARGKHKNVGEQLHKLAGLAAARSDDILYQQMISFWRQPQLLVRGASAVAHPALRARSAGMSLAEHMMASDAQSYLPDDILVKVDRASMAASLETRAPFLDPAVFEFAWKLPFSSKIVNGQTKWLLRQLLYRYVPKELIDRPKMGFGVPIRDWLRGPLKPWAEDLLTEDSLREYFNPKLVRTLWKQHQEGHHNWQYHLWSVLMFQQWIKL